MIFGHLLCKCALAGLTKVASQTVVKEAVKHAFVKAMATKPKTSPRVPR